MWKSPILRYQVLAVVESYSYTLSFHHHDEGLQVRAKFSRAQHVPLHKDVGDVHGGVEHVHVSENATFKALNVELDHHRCVCPDVLKKGGKSNRFHRTANHFQSLLNHL